MPGRAVFSIGPRAISLALPILNFFCRKSFRAASRMGLLTAGALAADGVAGPAASAIVTMNIHATTATGRPQRPRRAGIEYRIRIPMIRTPIRIFQRWREGERPPMEKGYRLPEAQV